MKVAHIISYFDNKGGGVERVICDMCEVATRRSGIEFVVFSYGNKAGTESIGRLRIRRLTGFIIAHMAVLPSLIRELLKEKPDIIHVHAPYPYGLISGLVVKTLLRKPLVVTYHSDPPVNLAISRIYKRLEPVLLGFADLVLATSHGYKENSEILRKLKNVEVFRLGINTANYFPGQLPDEHVILTVGRKTFYKNTEMLTQAMTHVNAEFPDVKLLITGHGYSEKEDKNIKFVGYVSEEELLSLYQRCMFFVLPSTTNDEGFGLVLLESMACGKPVVAFDLWGPREAIGDCGIIVKEKTVEALAEAMITLLKGENLRKDIGQKARERVLKNFSLEAYDGITDIYQRLACPVRP